MQHRYVEMTSMPFTQTKTDI